MEEIIAPAKCRENCRVGNYWLYTSCSCRALLIFKWTLFLFLLAFNIFNYDNNNHNVKNVVKDAVRFLLIVQYW